MEEKPERPDYEAQIAADVKSIRSAVNFFVALVIIGFLIQACSAFL